jgi:glutathione S-transferase
MRGTRFRAGGGSGRPARARHSFGAGESHRLFRFEHSAARRGSRIDACPDHRFALRGIAGPVARSVAIGDNSASSKTDAGKRKPRMTLKLYAHPLSSYCQKALIAFYENDIPFEFALVEPGSAASTEHARLWPLQKFPVLEDRGRAIPEASIIIEYLGLHHPGPVQLVPADAKAALDVRLMDRFFDNYVMTPQGNIVFDAIRPQGKQDAFGVEMSRMLLDKSYRWLDGHMAGRVWASGDGFSLADCAAAPALLYAGWTYPIPKSFSNVHAYRTRLLARPSYARALNEARPYRHMFPLGAPADRD